MRLVFMGTPDFARTILERLVADGHEVCGVFTQPDKPRNRNKVTPSPVKEYALSQNIPVFQPVTMRDGTALENFKTLAPELAVVAAYGRILPEEMLAVPVHGCINAHASILPKYRGAAPINRAILDGEKETGVTVMHMAKECDAGDMILVKKQAIRPDETAEDLFSKLNSNNQNSLNIIIKSDVKGSGEAIAHSLAELPHEKIKAEVVANAVGPISENDISLAAATNSIVVGFHVRVNPGVNEMAKKQKVEIRLYSIIYELLEDITDALAGKLEPEKREKPIGEAKILQIIELSKGPKICGCMVESGSVRVGAKARVRRDGDLIYNGEVASLRRFKDDVKEVKAGLECGIRLDNFADFLVNDEIEIYEIELKKATL